jgi:collagen triple helix repeat protein
MFKRIHHKLGTAGFIISIVALVAALGGGAYAANGGSAAKATASAKAKQGKQGKPGKTGPAGPAGATGPAGAPGAKGDTGAAGSNGTNGTNGKDGTNGTNGKSVKAESASVAECSTGGTKFEVEGSGTSSHVCNGAGGGGGGGFPATLPPGASETGTWWYQGNSGAAQAAPISFSIPLSAADAASIKTVHSSTETAATFEAECPGTIAEPQAKPGALCLYLSEEGNVSKPVEFYQPDFETTVSSGGLGTSGVLLAYENLDKEHIAGGSFAVTAPAAS